MLQVVETRISAIASLLETVSWSEATYFRRGGRGREDVLTAEVIQALDFLPRAAFLGAVVHGSHGAADTRGALVRRIEDAVIDLLPGDHFLVPRGVPGRRALSVQPDVVISTEEVLCFIEAKRIKPGSFQTEQLAREYLTVMKIAHETGRRPFLLLLLPKAPPVRVAHKGAASELLDIHAAIENVLDAVLERVGPERVGPEFGSREALLESIDDVVAWTTWPEIKTVIKRARQAFEPAATSSDRAISRLAGALLHALDWHADTTAIELSDREALPALCMYCRHLDGNLGVAATCAAFPEGVPVEIRENMVDHRSRVDNDLGITWEQNAARPVPPLDAYDRMFAGDV